MVALGPRQRCMAVLLVLGSAGWAAALQPPDKATDRVSADQAGRGPKLAVMAVAQDAAAHTAVGVLERAAEEAIERVGRFTLVPGGDAWNPAAARARSAAALEAAARHREGLAALDELDGQKAGQAFAAALAAWRRSDLTRWFPQLCTSWGFRAAAYAINGENAAANRELDAAIPACPTLELSPQYFPPEVLRHGELVRKGSAATSAAALTIRTVPSGAQVWVNGAYRGLSPVSVYGAAAGARSVVAVLGGTEVAATELGPTESTINLKPAELSAIRAQALSAILREPDGAGRDAAVRSVGKAMEVDEVLLVMAKKSVAGERLELLLLRFSLLDGHTLGLARVTVPKAGEKPLADSLSAVLVSDLPRSNGRPVTEVRTTGGAGEGGAGGTRRAFVAYSLLGAGVALAGVGVFCGLSASSRAADFRDRFQTQRTISANLAAEGRTFSVMADLFYLAGAAAATSGVLVAFLGGPWTPGPQNVPSR